MDGYQFLRQYRRERQTPVIIITAREEETDAVLGWIWAQTTTWLNPSGCASW